MRDGAFVTPPSFWTPNQPLQADSRVGYLRAGSNLHALALSWLREDRENRLAEEKSGKRVARGPKASDVSLESERGERCVDRFCRLSQIRRRSTRNMITRTRSPSITHARAPPRSLGTRHYSSTHLASSSSIRVISRLSLLSTEAGKAHRFKIQRHHSIGSTQPAFSYSSNRCPHNLNARITCIMKQKMSHNNHKVMPEQGAP
jgi:hypothetical protein